jgi:sulfane dehydrogenase subunit SoxC
VSSQWSPFLERAFVERVLSHNAPMDRRNLFVAAGAIGASALLSPAAAQVQPASAIASPPAPSPPRHRAQFVKDLSRLVDLNATNQGAAYWNHKTYITPLSDFFIRNEYPTPRAELDQRVDKATWRLKIHGDGIERPLEIGYDDLLKMPSRTMIATMECAGNGRSLFWEQQDMIAKPTLVSGTGWGLGGIGQAEWRYVPMTHILGLVGLKRTAKACLFWSGVDGVAPNTESDTGRPIPADALRLRGKDIGIAYQMNGADLEPDHGAPVRALVPGYCGAASTKWLTEIKIATHDFWVPLNVVRHVLFGPDYEQRAPKPAANDEFRFVNASQVRGIPVTWSPPRSLLTVPLVLEKQPKFPHNYPLKPGELPRIAAGAQRMRGYAWAPENGIEKVEVRVNGSAWQQVEMRDRLDKRYRWSRFEFPWTPTPGRHLVETRVTDTRGTVQPESVPYNEGGFNGWMIPKFHIEAV